MWMPTRLAVGALLACSLVLLAAGCQNEVPILTYHWFGAGSQLSWDMDPEQFRQEMDELSARGCTAISLDQLYDYLDGKGALPERPVVLTFDDGEQGFYRTAFPILREHGFKATLFVVTDLLRERPEARYVWTMGEAKLPMLLWSEVQEMAASEVVEMGSHTRTHPNLTKISLDEARAEIEGSKAVLEQRLGRPAKYFAYPGHHHNAALMELVQKAGYRGAVDGWTRTGGRFDLFRISIWRGATLDDFRRTISQSWADAYSQP